MLPVLGELKIKYGKVSYRHAFEDTPAHFHVEFTIDSTFTNESLETLNIFYWNVAVPDLDRDASYSEIESAASRQIAPMLRLLAADIEAREAKAAAPKQKPATE